ncbi:hypothetical protein GCM10019017_67790 [Streptomyces showdoensis]
MLSPSGPRGFRRRRGPLPGHAFNSMLNRATLAPVSDVRGGLVGKQQRPLAERIWDDYVKEVEKAADKDGCAAGCGMAIFYPLF